MTQAQTAGAPAVQNKEKTVLDLLNDPETRKAIKAALPKHLTADRYLRICLTACNIAPKLKVCTTTSLWDCVLWLAQIGLEPDGRKAHLIPFENKRANRFECKVIVDYKGLVELARRSKEIGGIHADVVREGDEFDFRHGTDGFLRHRPKPNNLKAKITYGYTCVDLKGFAKPSFEVMDIDSILAIRDRSEAYKAFKAGFIKSTPWITDEGEMMKKTVFRRHSKWLPVSNEYLEAVAKDFDTPDFSPDAADPTEQIHPAERAADAPADATVGKPEGFISKEQARQVQELRVAFKAPEKEFLEYLKGTFNIETPDEIQQKDYPAVAEWIVKNKK